VRPLFAAASTAAPVGRPAPARQRAGKRELTKVFQAG
jgi:hypothetical protein